MGLQNRENNKLEYNRRLINPAFLFMLPAVLLFILLALYPTLQALWTSLFQYNITRPLEKTFIFLGNYIDLLTSQRFWLAFGRTAIYVIVSVGLSFTIGFGVALLLSKIKRMKNFFQASLLIPMIISPTVAAYNFRFMYNYNFGIFNEILTQLGFSRIDFLGHEVLALFSTILIDVWQWTPLVILILLAGIESLPREPYEAALVDGAGPIKTFFSLTLPLLKPFIVVTLLLRLMDSVKVYEYVYLVTSGGPGRSTETLNIYLSTVGFDWFELGQASAIGFIILNCTALVAMLFVKNAKLFDNR